MLLTEEVQRYFTVFDETFFENNALVIANFKYSPNE